MDNYHNDDTAEALASERSSRDEMDLEVADFRLRRGENLFAQAGGWVVELAGYPNELDHEKQGWFVFNVYATRGQAVEAIKAARTRLYLKDVPSILAEYEDTDECHEVKVIEERIANISREIEELERKRFDACNEYDRRVAHLLEVANMERWEI